MLSCQWMYCSSAFGLSYNRNAFRVNSAMSMPPSANRERPGPAGPGRWRRMRAAGYDLRAAAASDTLSLL
jgi:hypothetical protein